MNFWPQEAQEDTRVNLEVLFFVNVESLAVPSLSDPLQVLFVANLREY